MQSHEYYPYYEALESLSTQAHNIPVKLDHASLLEANLEKAKSWKEYTAKMFLKKNTGLSLLQASATFVIITAKNTVFLVLHGVIRW